MFDFLRLAAVVVVVSAAAGARAADPWPDAPPAHDHATVVEAITRTAVGDTILWISKDGAEGWGVVAAVHGTTLHCQGGEILELRELDQLWRRHRSKSAAVGRATVGGFLIGVVGAVALGNTYGTDGGGLENLGVALVGTMAIASGTVMGLLVGAASPPAATWQRLIPDRRLEGREQRPPGIGEDVVRLAYLELGGELRRLGWENHRESGARAAVGVWMPLMRSLDGGLSASMGAAPDFDGSVHWEGAGPLAISGDVRILLSENSAFEPYFGVGVGWYGDLNDDLGWKVCIGLRGMMVGRSTLRLEAGSVGGFSAVEDDRPGLAYLALRFGWDLGDREGSD